MKFTKFLKEQIDNVEKMAYEKEHKEEGDKRSENRSHFERDYARTIYSNAFKRLQGKMQLFPVSSVSFSRNRLTHSLEVSQIAREIVELLRKKHEEELKNETGECNCCTNKRLDIRYFNEMAKVVETASFLHDIGNPPFGHHGERILNDLSKANGFEGNAQGIRIIRKIEKKFPDIAGLNLTLQTQAAIIKYYNKYDGKHKKFLYKDDYEELNSLFSRLDVKLRTIDVQIIDLADEIAYCAHDLEDALSGNYFTIDELLFLLSKKSQKNYDIFKEWVNEAKDKAFSGSSDINYDYDFYFRRELISIIVHKLINNIGISVVTDVKETGTQCYEELEFQEYKELVKDLKKMIFKGVSQSNIVKVYENVGTKVLKSLYEMYSNEELNPDGMLMPVEYRWAIPEDKNRNILDYLSGMMDTYAIEIYEKYFGENPFDKLYWKK